ncbi:MAG TPA: TonB-dependent receptor [Vicinamibacterales bacterium]
MRSHFVMRALLASLLMLPASAFAQEAIITGAITDTTGGALPGVTITATNEATGNTYTGVTDERGEYRIAVRIGGYRVSAELSGFATVSRGGLEVLVGQQRVLNLQMAPANLQESVTVTAEAPLVDVTQSKLGGNIDQRQMQELPVNGRNWLDLTQLAPGSRANAGGGNAGDDPLPRGNGTYQLNVDGQQVTNTSTISFGQPHFSRDAIAEFEYVANRFDASQGRSSGIQVNAVTKSGTNTPNGTFGGYFRDDKFNAADPIAKRVLPYSDQQLSATYGGPIRKDRIHYFLSYDYEREPKTFAYTTPYPHFNQDVADTHIDRKALARVDFQLSPRTHASLRGSHGANLEPHNPTYSGGANRTPSGSESNDLHFDNLQLNIAQVASAKAVNELKIGYAGFHWIQMPTARWSQSPTGLGAGSPRILLRGGLTIGQAHTLSPENIGQDVYSFRDDFSYTYTAAGRHTLKAGGEYLHYPQYAFFCNNCNPTIDATNGPIPANIESLFPDINNADTWNLAALSPITKTFLQGIGDFRFHLKREVGAGWIQDDWTVTERLTLNLGLRYDVAEGLFGEETAVPPFLPGGRPIQKNRFQPRPGFAYTVDDRTVIRGGVGKFFAEVPDQPSFWAKSWASQLHPQINNDGRADFAANPFNRPGVPYAQAVPSLAQVSALTCQATGGAPGCFRPSISSQLITPGAQVPYSWQASIGVQRQIGNDVGVNADYVYEAQRHAITNLSNTNLSFDANGVPRNYLIPANDPYPNVAQLAQTFTEGSSNYQALSTALTKRFSKRWEGSATYTLGFLRDRDYCPPVAPSNASPGYCGEYGLATSDQRHRAVFNAIWQGPHDVQVSGLYFYGSGYRYGTSYGQDVLNSGQGTSARFRPNGTIVPRNNFVGTPIHRVDMRFVKKLRLSNRVSIDGLAEVFNLFNHGNYGAFVTQETAANFGAPSFVSNVNYYARMVQLGFRTTF